MRSGYQSPSHPFLPSSQIGGIETEETVIDDNTGPTFDTKNLENIENEWLKKKKKTRGNTLPFSLYVVYRSNLLIF